MDNDKASQIAGNLGVRHVPSIIVYDFTGRLVTLNGLQDIMNNMEKTIEVWDRKMGNI
jgi:thioredoxin-like negative regulator of GroEL